MVTSWKKNTVKNSTNSFETVHCPSCILRRFYKQMIPVIEGVTLFEPLLQRHDETNRKSQTGCLGPVRIGVWEREVAKCAVMRACLLECVLGHLAR